MKKPIFLLFLFICPFFTIGQVGIGTTSPNAKSLLDLNSTTQGLLLPRLTSADRISMALSANDAGMVVYQTSPTKGIFIFDGTNWIGLPTLTPSANQVGATLRWDGTSWVSMINLFNQGSSIGIGTTSPKSQLHIHSTAAPVSRIHVTNPASMFPGSTPLLKDGLLIGMGPSGEAFINQQEIKPLVFSIDSIERVRIDSAGNVGINKNNPSAKLDVNGTVKLGDNGLSIDADGNVGINESEPSAKLDVNGTVKLGENGTVINCILRNSVMLDIPNISNGGEYPYSVPFSNAIVGATVLVSPSLPMTGVMIGYAMVSAPGFIEIKFMNMGDEIDLANMVFYITVIQ